MSLTDQQRREGYAREWLAVYHGDHPLFAELKAAAAGNETWVLPPAVVTAVVRFSADEVWKPDPSLELACRNSIPNARAARREAGLTSQIAYTEEERAQIRQRARAGYRQHRRRR